MLTVNILHTGSAYVPEVEAYRSFLELHGCKVSVLKDLKAALREDADVLIIMMGRHYFWQEPKTNIAVIHEYHSLGTGRLARVKDLVRRLLSYRPEGRIFLNEEVKRRMGFTDKVPFIYRDMGVPEYFYHRLNNRTRWKQFDFVYVGQINRRRRISNFLVGFVQQVPEMSLALIGHACPNVKSNFARWPNIHFLGPVQQNEIPDLLAQCKYAVNYVPDVYPYNIQTSTKLLEYIVLGLPVVTTDYAWVRKFEEDLGVSLPKIGERCEGLRRLIESGEIKPVMVDVTRWRWDKVLEESGFYAFVADIACRKK